MLPTAVSTSVFSYAAFGELLNSSGDTDNAYLFTGEQYDDSVDNYYLRARYYNPEIGRFTRQDEWLGRDGEPLTLNKYLYTHADPVNGTDPSGYMNLAFLNVGQNILGVLVQAAHRQFFKSAFRDLGCVLGFALAE